MKTLNRLTYIIALLWFVNQSIAEAQSDFISRIPILKINTFGEVISDEPKKPAELLVIDNGVGKLNKFYDTPTLKTAIGIELRGKSSIGMEKKSYGIEIRDNAGNDTDYPLLGMPAGSDWGLVANYSDKTMVRNALTYLIGTKTPYYSPRTKYCEVFLNASYQGVYLVTELIKREKNRIDIAKLNPDETSGEDVTGGYILKIDKFDAGDQAWYSNYDANGRGIQFIFSYPKSENIIDEQRAYIKAYVDSFERALAGASFKNPSTGYRKFIDVNSFIDYYLITELTHNIDGYRISTYFYKDKLGKLTMGPLWDYDLAWGNANYYNGSNTAGWIEKDYESNGGLTDNWQIPFWWERFLEDSAFTYQMYERWTRLRRGALATDSVVGYITKLYRDMDYEAVQRNFVQWRIIGKYVWPNDFIGENYDQELSHLKMWAIDRLRWMDTNMPGRHDVAISENLFALQVRSYPNPFTDKLTFDFFSENKNIVTVSIYDCLWHCVYRENKIIYPGTNSILFENSTLASGMYFYQFSHEQQIITSGKIIKK